MKMAAALEMAIAQPPLSRRFRPLSAASSCAAPPTCFEARETTCSLAHRARKPASLTPMRSRKCARRVRSSCAIRARGRRAPCFRLPPPRSGLSSAISPWEAFARHLYAPGRRGAAAGNSVIAKPAEADAAHRPRGRPRAARAGVRAFALQLITGAGEVGATLVADAAFRESCSPARLHRTD